MSKLTSYIVSIVIQKGSDPLEPANRLKIGQFEGFLSIFSNIILFGIKLALGISSYSIALLADAFHTLMDVGTSIIVILGFKMSQKPADAEHPFGHGRAETIASLSIAFLIGLVGFEFLKSSIERMIHHEIVAVNFYMILIIFVTIIIKEIMAKISHELAHLIDSDALRGDAVHHHSDSLSSMLVIVGLIGINFNMPWLDSLMGVGVSGFILYTGYELAKNAIDELLGKPPSKEFLEIIKSEALKVKGVFNIHDIIVHQYGFNKYISLHVEVGDNNTADKLHFIADEVELLIEKKTRADVVTHIDPISVSNCVENKIKEIVKPVLEKYSLESIQDLRIEEEDGILREVKFEIPISVEFNFKKDVNLELVRIICGKYPESNPQIFFKNQILKYVGA
jgi:cation diffusion facilitator family transporter